MQTCLMVFVFLVHAQTAGAMHRASDLYPHPTNPAHLRTINLDIALSKEVKHWFWTSRDALALRKIRIEQKRAGDGWYICDVRFTDLDGHLNSPVRIDPTLRDPTMLLLIALNDDGSQDSSAQLEIPSKELLKDYKGKVVLK